MNSMGGEDSDQNDSEMTEGLCSITQKEKERLDGFLL